MEVDLNEWEEHVPGPGGNRINFNKQKVKDNLKNMPDEEYINPEERLRDSQNTGRSSK